MLFFHIELPAKLLDYFLRSNKSNIDQLGSCSNMSHRKEGFEVSGFDSLVSAVTAQNFVPN